LFVIVTPSVEIQPRATLERSTNRVLRTTNPTQATGNQTYFPQVRDIYNSPEVVMLVQPEGYIN
jgi:hypothetical protein